MNNATLSDVTFLVEGRRFHAHRIALLASSDTFRVRAPLPSYLPALDLPCRPTPSRRSSSGMVCWWPQATHSLGSRMHASIWHASAPQFASFAASAGKQSKNCILVSGPPLTLGLDCGDKAPCCMLRRWRKPCERRQAQPPLPTPERQAHTLLLHESRRWSLRSWLLPGHVRRALPGEGGVHHPHPQHPLWRV